MRKPVWVYVYWSENNRFNDNDLMSFDEFERKCKGAAREVGVGNGYDKTKIKVLFDNGEHYDTRLDLCPEEDTGFKSYCEGMINWIGSDRFNQTYNHDTTITHDYVKLKEYLLGIEWP